MHGSFFIIFFSGTIVGSAVTIYIYRKLSPKVAAAVASVEDATNKIRGRS